MKTEISTYKNVYHSLKKFGAPQTTTIKAIYMTKNINETLNGSLSEKQLKEISQNILFMLEGCEGEAKFAKEILE